MSIKLGEGFLPIRDVCVTERFELLGHDCVYGEYPSPVVPVGHLDGRLVAIYPGGSAGAVAEYIDLNSRYTRHTGPLKKYLRDFDYRKHRLFAYDADRVVRYLAPEEAEFLAQFLSGPEGKRTSPGIRAMLERHLKGTATAITAHI